MANGIYTALDQDINYLAHFGRKGMKWYHHLLGAQESLSKYAKGAQTKGIDLNQYKKDAARNEEAAKTAAKTGSRGAYVYFKKEANRLNKAIKDEESKISYNKRTRVTRALAGAAAKVAGAGASALLKGIRATNKVNRFIKRKNYRNKVITNWKKKASDFGNTIRTAIGKAAGRVGSAAGKAANTVRSTVGKVADRAKVKYDAFKTTQRTKKGVEAGRNRAEEYLARDRREREKERIKKNKKYQGRSYA